MLQQQAVVTSNKTCSGIVPMKTREHFVSVEDFGGRGDGYTVNTMAFQKAVSTITHQQRGGTGTLLYVPSGVFLTGPFNLTSHMTLYLAKGAVIRATQDTQNWPLIAPLPSYGRGRDLPGGRYMSFLLGDGLDDVIITGENGTIDGQGDIWWNMVTEKSLQFTRPGLVEFMNSKNILISSLTFVDSPFWNIHPVYCRNVVIRNMTILAPHNSHNTDGVDPDSSSNVCIEDCYINTGDDLVAVKSGWDEYGIAYGQRSSGITIRRLTGSTKYAGIAIGSELSGGIENVLAEDINLFDLGIGIHIKSFVGRGGYVRNVTLSDMRMYNVTMGIQIVGASGGPHPDEKFNPLALTLVHGVTIKNIRGAKVVKAGTIQGFQNSPFNGISLENVKLHALNGSMPSPWICSDASGTAQQVEPLPCPEFI